MNNNYPFPYMNYYPYMTPMMRPTLFGGLSRLFRSGINWSSLFNNTQRTLSIINQAIPAIKQVTPIVKNAKTMFRLMNEFKKIDTPTDSISSNSSNDNITTTSNNPTSVNDYGPTFFI